MMRVYRLVLGIVLAMVTLYAEPVKIMLLGDSITYDDAYKDHAELGGTVLRPASLRDGYRNDLWYMLNDAGYSVDFVGSQVAGSAIEPPFDPDNEGYPGATSYDIANLVYGKLVENPADIILLYIGANDWSDSVNGINLILNNIDQFERDFSHPVKVIIARIANRQTYHAWMSYLNRNIQALAQQRIANGDDLLVVDMEYGAGLNYSTDFQDRTHPNDVGYHKIAQVWFEALQKILKPKSENFAWLAPVYLMMMD